MKVADFFLNPMKLPKNRLFAVEVQNLSNALAQQGVLIQSSRTALNNNGFFSVQDTQAAKVQAVAKNLNLPVDFIGVSELSTVATTKPIVRPTPSPNAPTNLPNAPIPNPNQVTPSTNPNTNPNNQPGYATTEKDIERYVLTGFIVLGAAYLLYKNNNPGKRKRRR